MLLIRRSFGCLALGFAQRSLLRGRLEQIINMRHELVQFAGKIDWEFIDGEIAPPLYSDGGRPGIATQFVIGLFLLKHIYVTVRRRRVRNPYFQHSPERSSSSTSFRTSART